MKNGFSLAETLVSISIFLVFTAAFAPVIKASAKVFMRYDSVSCKLREIENKMEYLKSTKFEELRDDPNTTITVIDESLKSVEVKMDRFCLFTMRSKY